MAENNAAQEPQPENQEAAAFESPAQSASQPQTSQAGKVLRNQYRACGDPPAINP